MMPLSPPLNHEGVLGGMILLHQTSAVNLWVLGVRQACFSSDFRRRSRSTRFTSVLSDASEIQRGKPYACRKISPFPSVRLRFPSFVSHTLSVFQRRRHDKTQFREARMERE